MNKVCAVWFVVIATAFAAFGQSSSPTTSSSSLLPPGRRVALVIGNDSYRQQALANAVNDATAMAAGLTSAGYAVTLATNTSLSQLTATFETFANDLRAGDIALVYYAGHGFQIDSENYIVPVDFAASDPVTATKMAFPMSRVTYAFRQRNVHTGILIADACRNNPFSAARSSMPGLAAMASGSGLLVSFATSPGEVASDNPLQKHGLFTSALIDNLRRPGLTIDQIFTATADQVTRESNGVQVPWTASALRGPIPFSAPLAPTLATAAITPYGRGVQGVAVPAAGSTVAQETNGAELLIEIGDEIRSGNAQQAMVLINQAPSQNDPDGRLLAYKGQSLLMLGQYPDALASLNLAIQKAPLDPLRLYLRALGYSLLGQYQAALHDVSLGLNARPEDLLFLTVKANILFVTGDYASAMTICDHIINSDGMQPAAYVIRGNSERMLGHLVAATTDFTTATTLQGSK